ncbi:Do/DeqQ family serine protease [Lewinella marina]|uniref:Protease Do n=1 Tax=Neolewinella marina TaxID=438751 RepID=A0A2G0CFH9_9BACT|nr:trypsin-like peptidase domain-containing protein [Neolewinella marina]NJB85587.1 Do/DeqQ family serine protease [Neolewinella marina]PHK98729.1 protease Do [Neolewinella marina]
MSLRTIVVFSLACFASAVLGVAAGRWFIPGLPAEEMPVNPSREDLRLRTFASSAPTSFITAAERVTPAVVSVRSYMREGLLSGAGGNSVTTGSAVIISPDGLVATNNHVIEGARRIRITLQDRREFNARVVGVDESTDLALLKINATDLPTAHFGNSDSLRVGEWVLAVGNPYSLNSTVTTGIVSAKGRSIDVLRPDDRIESFIQTDAAVNPGNSGGALVNTAGELIGINTAIITNSGRHEGYAFAIPGNLARRVLNDLRDYGEVQRAVLGVWIQGINDAQAKQLRLPAASGALITDLTPNGPAARAGLQMGDVMTAINGVAINSSPEMQEQLSRYRPGQRVQVTFIRDGESRSKTVLLTDKTNRPGTLVSERTDDRLHLLGFELRDLSADEWQRFPGGGVRVVSIFRDSPIAATHMNAGFVITQVDNVPVASLDELLRRIRHVDAPLFGGFYEGYEGEYFYRPE